MCDQHSYNVCSNMTAIKYRHQFELSSTTIERRAAARLLIKDFCPLFANDKADTFTIKELEKELNIIATHSDGMMVTRRLDGYCCLHTHKYFINAFVFCRIRKSSSMQHFCQHKPTQRAFLMNSMQSFRNGF